MGHREWLYTMADESTFGGSIRARAHELGIQDESGRTTPAALATFLNRHWRLPPGDQIRDRTVASWFKNERVPPIGRLLRLLHALGVTGDEHARILKLAGDLDEDDLPPIESELLRPDGTVNTDGHPGERGLDVVLTEVPFTLSDHDSPHDGADSDAA
jgi:hypothetical protein